MTSVTPLESVQACWSRVGQSSVYNFFFSNIEIVSAEPGHMVARLPVSDKLVNSKNGLHGSVSAAIVDLIGGLAIASHGFEQTGLSVDIHVTYVSTAKVGEVLTIEGTTTKVGRNLGFTTTMIYKGEGETKVLVAHGSHTKYIQRDAAPKDKSV